MSNYGFEVYSENGVPFLHEGSPFQIIYRLRITNLTPVTNYQINIPEVESGSTLLVVNGLLGSDVPDRVVSLGGNYQLSAHSVSFVGNDLRISLEDTFGEDAGFYDYTIFTRR